MNRIIEFIVEFVHDEHRLSLLLFLIFFGFIVYGASFYVKELFKELYTAYGYSSYISCIKALLHKKDDKDDKERNDEK